VRGTGTVPRGQQPSVSPPPRAPPPRLCARRYARHDIYGLAAGLATSWAALAASTPARVEHCLTHALLADCAPALQRVRSCARVLRQAGPRGLRPSGRRAEQVVALWSLKGAPEAWGGAAAPGAALLTQYHSGMSAVFLWLTSAPQPLPPRALVTEAAHLTNRETMLGDAAQARAAHATSRCLQPRPRAPTAPRTARRSTCAPQKAARYAACGAASGDLLVTVMEQALLGGRGARLSGLGRRGGRRAAGSARAEARRRAGRRRPHSGAHALGDDCAWHRVRDPGVH